MRRLPTTIFLVLVLALLVVTPVSAAPAETGVKVMIAVPDYIPVNGELDLVVFTKQSTETVEVPFQCFYKPDVYPVYDLVIKDDTSGQHGRATHVIANMELGSGTRLRGMILLRICAIAGSIYRVYEGYTLYPLDTRP